MKRGKKCEDARVLGVDLCAKGFGFAVIENVKHLVDWGVTHVWSRNAQEFLIRIERLIERHRPVLIVTEEIPFKKARRGARTLTACLEHFARERRIRFVRCTRAQIRSAFRETGETKHDIAVALAKEFPELESRLPRRRRAWESEDSRMNIFDALSLIVAAGCPTSDDD